MIVDLGQLNDPRNLGSEVVIIGGGAAGITLAAALSSRGIDVTILEAGGIDVGSYDVQFFDGDVAGLRYDLLTSRQRSLGGATNRWSGWSRPIDDFVFRRRQWVGDIGWPFAPTEMTPWFRKAHTFLGLGEYVWDTATLERRTAITGIGSPKISDKLTAPLWRFVDQPLAFQERYADVLNRPNVKVILKAPVEDLRIVNGRARSATVVAPSTTRVEISGNHFFLAAGGIENLRLLLALQAKHRSRGLNLNSSGWLGQGWMEHPHVRTGYLLAPSTILNSTLFFQSDFRISDGTRVIAGIGLTPEVLERERLPNVSFSLFNSITSQTAATIPHLSAVEDAVSNLSRSGTQLRSLFARSESRVLKRSRVTLSDRRDRFGLPLARLDWQVAPRDFPDLYRSQDLVASELGRLGLGVVAEDRRPIPDRIIGGNHHIGGARMSTDPKTGVTDEFGHLFGLKGVSVTGSALFPTGGFSNPTMTIVAIALRQAAHYVTHGRR